DRVPRERPEDEQHRGKEEQRRQAAAPHPRERRAPHAAPARDRSAAHQPRISHTGSRHRSTSRSLSVRAAGSAGGRLVPREPTTRPPPARYLPCEINVWALLFACPSNCVMLAFLSVRTACTTAS